MRHLICRIAFAAVLISASTASAGKNDKRLDIYWVDVEGGAATMIITPQGESILIDTGNPGRRDPDRIARVATRVAGVRRIDHLIITHYHGDHFGGAANLSLLLPIKAVYDNGKFKGMPNDPGKEYFNFKCGKRVVVNPGTKIKLAQRKGAAKLNLHCVGTRRSFIKPGKSSVANSTLCAQHKSKNRDGSDNANSVVMVLQFGGFRFYDGGDLTWNEEKKLVCPKNLIGKVDVYQVTHHGLDSSNNPIVLNSLAPTVSIMNNGKTKGCAPEVFANLLATKSISQMYQLHKNVRPDGVRNNVADKFIANVGKKTTGNIIKLSVAPDGKSYTVSIPKSGHKKKFATSKK